MVDENGKPIYGEVSDKEILAHLDRHSKAVMKDFYRTSEFCSACHKAALPRILNDYKWQRAIFLYDEWQLSSFAKQSPLPFYVKDQVSTCQTCHMKQEEIQLPDYGAKDGKLASHRWLGANTVLSKYYGYDAQMDKTIAFLRNGVLNVDIFGIERNGDKIIAPLGSQPFRDRSWRRPHRLRRDSKQGHRAQLVPEQRDFYESWVEFEAKDAAGRTLMHSGALQPEARWIRARIASPIALVNAQGRLNDLHQVWDTRVVAYNNTIQSGRSQIVRYEFNVPADAAGPITVTAKVNYRRFNQHFIDYGLGKHYEMPVVEIAARTRTLAVGSNPAAPDPQDNKDWMRWNNYGIGLLDAQQYAESAHAFERVTELRPDYADAYTNVAIADFNGNVTTTRAPAWRRPCSLLRTMPARFITLRWLSARRGIWTRPSAISARLRRSFRARATRTANSASRSISSTSTTRRERVRDACNRSIPTTWRPTIFSPSSIAGWA
jgi:hypothetical protein